MEVANTRTQNLIHEHVHCIHVCALNKNHLNLLLHSMLLHASYYFPKIYNLVVASFRESIPIVSFQNVDDL